MIENPQRSKDRRVLKRHYLSDYQMRKLIQMWCDRTVRDVEWRENQPTKIRSKQKR